MKIKKGDNIIVLTGKDKGKTGTVARTFPKTDKVIVEGINMAKCHEKSNRRGQSGQIVERAMPMHVSNVGLKDSKTGKPGRIGYTIESGDKKSKKVRVTRPSGVKA